MTGFNGQQDNPIQPKGMTMDTTSYTDRNSTIGGVVASALIQGAAAQEALKQARAAFEVGDVDKARLIVNNGSVPSSPDSPAESLNALVYAQLPRGGDDNARVSY